MELWLAHATDMNDIEQNEESTAAHVPYVHDSTALELSQLAEGPPAQTSRALGNENMQLGAKLPGTNAEVPERGTRVGHRSDSAGTRNSKSAGRER